MISKLNFMCKISSVDISYKQMSKKSTFLHADTASFLIQYRHGKMSIQVLRMCLQMHDECNHKKHIHVVCVVRSMCVKICIIKCD